MEKDSIAKAEEAKKLKRQMKFEDEKEQKKFKSMLDEDDDILFSQDIIDLNKSFNPTTSSTQASLNENEISIEVNEINEPFDTTFEFDKGSSSNNDDMNLATSSNVLKQSNTEKKKLIRLAQDNIIRIKKEKKDQ